MLGKFRSKRGWSVQGHPLTVAPFRMEADFEVRQPEISELGEKSCYAETTREKDSRWYTGTKIHVVYVVNLCLGHLACPSPLRAHVLFCVLAEEYWIYKELSYKSKVNDCDALGRGVVNGRVASGGLLGVVRCNAMLTSFRGWRKFSLCTTGQTVDA